MTNLPATLVEAEAVETITHWIDVIAEGLTSDTSRLVVRALAIPRLSDPYHPHYTLVEPVPIWRSMHRPDEGDELKSIEFPARGPLPPPPR